MTSKRKTVRASIRVRAYDVIARAVEEGIAYGYRRAHKHEDDPGEDAIKDEIHASVMGALCDVLDFD